MAPAEPAGGAPASPLQPARSAQLGGLVRRFGWIAVVAAFGIGAAIFAAGRDSSGEITRSGNLPIGDLRVGDCFDPKDIDAEEADDVSAKPCGESHQFELIAIEDMPEGGYPSDAEFEASFASICLPAFADYVGRAYEDSRLDLYWYVPVEGSWDQGDRSIQCAVFDPLDSQIVGSLRGADR